MDEEKAKQRKRENVRNSIVYDSTARKLECLLFSIFLLLLLFLIVFVCYLWPFLPQLPIFTTIASITKEDLPPFFHSNSYTKDDVGLVTPQRLDILQKHGSDQCFHYSFKPCADIIGPDWINSPLEVNYQPRESRYNEEYLLKHQKPRAFKVLGLRAMPFWDYEDFPASYKLAISLLESSWQELKQEYYSLHPRIFTRDGQNLSEFNEWKILHYQFNGQPCAMNLEKAPKVNLILQTINLITGGLAHHVAGITYTSVMTPGTHVRAHFGPNNIRIRCHLGLYTPANVSIRVGEEIRAWEEGKVFCFDDSFNHEVWHYAKEDRIVLIVDFWHPDLYRNQILALHRYYLRRRERNNSYEKRLC